MKKKKKKKKKENVYFDQIFLSGDLTLKTCNEAASKQVTYSYGDSRGDNEVGSISL